jgi:hypothetical protein
MAHDSYGVMDNYDKSSGTFDYVSAVEVSVVEKIPEGMMSWDIPAQKYAVRIPVKTITFSGRCRSLRPDDADRTFRCMAMSQGDCSALTQERDDAGYEIIPLTVVFVQWGMNFSHRFSLKF